MSIQANFPAIAPSLLLDFANTKQLDNRITFTRSTPAVYYDGKTTAMAEQNTVLYSQDIANGYWTKYQVSLSSATAPDGTSTASTLTEAITDNNHAIWTTAGPIVTTTDISSTFSIYAKAGTCSTFAIQIYRTGVGFFIDFDLTTVASNIRSGGTGTSSITAVGGGWYRCTVTSSSLGSNTWQFEVYMTLTYGGSSSYLGTGRTLSLWGVQAEQRSSVTAYTVTTTQAITNYIPVLLSAGGNQARFDCNPTTGESLGLLIEEQRTNLVSYSADFSNGAWVPDSGVTITANTVIAPDGTLSADTYSSTTNGLVLYRGTPSTLSVNAFTVSVYAKTYSATSLDLYLVTSGYTAGAGCTYNLINGTSSAVLNYGATTGSTSTITSVGNGWYRCTLTITAIASAYYFQIGSSVGSISIWGAQLEQGAFATSYIATTSASVTRTQDNASMTGTNFSSWYNQGQGTFYAQANLSNGGRYFNTYKSSSQFQIEGVQGPTYYESFVYDGAVQTQIQITAAQFISHKVATAYAVNDIAGCVDGGTVGTDTTAVLPIGLDTLNINAYTSGGPYGSGTIKKIAYYPIRLSNTNIQALTS
jgi:hypothetical protein